MNLSTSKFYALIVLIGGVFISSVSFAQSIYGELQFYNKTGETIAFKVSNTTSNSTLYGGSYSMNTCVVKASGANVKNLNWYVDKDNLGGFSHNTLFLDFYAGSNCSSSIYAGHIKAHIDKYTDNNNNKKYAVGWESNLGVQHASPSTGHQSASNNSDSNPSWAGININKVTAEN